MTTRRRLCRCFLPDAVRRLRIRDALEHLIEFQGDTGFASVEQQKNLLERAPMQYDLESVIRVNREQMRHGWQMAYVRVTCIGDSGKRQSERLLQRRASSRSQYLKEVGAIVDSLNHNVPEGRPKLRMPDEKFHRSIGEYAGKTYGVTGELSRRKSMRSTCKRFFRPTPTMSL